jgi:hypothetical protein
MRRRPWTALVFRGSADGPVLTVGDVTDIPVGYSGGYLSVFPPRLAPKRSQCGDAEADGDVRPAVQIRRAAEQVSPALGLSSIRRRPVHRTDREG